MTTEEAFSLEFHKFEKLIPEKYRNCRVNDLRPSPLSRLPVLRQEALYNQISAEPLAGYAFFGPAGSSKTTCSTALFRYACLKNLEHWWKGDTSTVKAWEWASSSDSYHQPAERMPRIHVWRKSVPDLLQQHFDIFNFRSGGGWPKPPRPDVTVEKIQDAVALRFTPRVFLEEIDKIKPSEFSINQLFRIIDAIDRNKGQLVIDTNLTRQQFLDTFGEPIYRRVKENCHMKDLYLAK